MDVSRCDHLELRVVGVLVARRRSGIGRVMKQKIIMMTGKKEALAPLSSNGSIESYCHGKVNTPTGV
jgi:hypothetical protein